MSDLKLVALAFGPLFLGLTVHGFCLRLGWLRGIAAPIDGGGRVHGRPLFGPNKTWRGVVITHLLISLAGARLRMRASAR